MGVALMNLRSAAGDITLAVSPTVLSATTLYSQLHAPHAVAGFLLPNWVGLLLYGLAILLGTVFSLNQPTPVDHLFKYSCLRPLYSVTFGVFATLFVIPVFFPNVDIWQLIVPALISASAGSVVVYYTIAAVTGEELWAEIRNAIVEFIKGRLPK